MEEEKFMFRDGSFLKKESIQSPEEVIKEFYTFYSLEDVTTMVWKLFKGSMNSNTQVFNLPEENSNVIFFIENFLLFNMAVHELSQRWE